MIEFHETIHDINDAVVWDIYLRDQKIGTLRKELFKKIKGVQHGGKYYLNVLYRDYVLPMKPEFKKMIPKIVQGAVDSIEADVIISRVEKSGWKDSRWITLEKARHAQENS